MVYLSTITFPKSLKLIVSISLLCCIITPAGADVPLKTCADVKANEHCNVWESGRPVDTLPCLDGERRTSCTCKCTDQRIMGACTGKNWVCD